MSGPYAPCIQNLVGCQRQLDAGGCEVGVSRQALDETMVVLDDLLSALRVAENHLVSAYGEPDPNGPRSLESPTGRQAILTARAVIAKTTGQRELATPPPGFEQWGRT